MTNNDSSARTQNGWRLAYAWTGQRDGFPLFYFHGFPGWRLDFHQPFVLRSTGSACG